MKRIALCFLLVAVGFGMASCARERLSFEPTEAERLTQKEKFALIDYVRGFVLSSKKLKLTGAEREIIRKTDPRIRIHYTAPKEGRLNMVWEFKAGRTLSALCHGPLQTRNNPTDWQINLTSGKLINAEDPALYGITD